MTWTLWNRLGNLYCEDEDVQQSISFKFPCGKSSPVNFTQGELHPYLHAKPQLDKIVTPEPNRRQCIAVKRVTFHR